MEIIVGKTAGFCFGIRSAVEKTEQILKKEGKTYCLGELAHNSQVMKRLCEKGLIVINNLDEIAEQRKPDADADMKSSDTIKCIIRAHGVPPEIYEQASSRKIELVDFTCPKVSKTHDKVRKYISENSYIFILGTKNHPEIIGTLGFCNGNASVIESKEDIEDAIQIVEKAGLSKIAVIAQTTFSVKKFDEIIEDLEDKIHKKFTHVELKVDNTICSATEERQEEVEKLSKEAEIMIIIGGKNSSNTKKLYEVSSKYCSNVLFIETANEIDIDKISRTNKIGIMAGASTPIESIEEVVEKLNKIM